MRGGASAVVSTADNDGDDGAEGARMTDDDASLVQGGSLSAFAGPTASAGFAGEARSGAAAERGDQQMQSASIAQVRGPHHSTGVRVLLTGREAWNSTSWQLLPSAWRCWRLVGSIALPWEAAHPF